MPQPDPNAALAAQVADLRGQVVALRARMDAAGISGSAKLHEQVAALTRQVEDLASGGGGISPAAPDWTRLDNAERAAALAELAAWVDGFLVPNYPHAGLRACWQAHAAAVWELSTLHAEWARVYGRERPELSGALAWHDRWLPGVATRLGVILSDCKARCALASSRRPRAV